MDKEQEAVDAVQQLMEIRRTIDKYHKKELETQLKWYLNRNKQYDVCCLIAPMMLRRGVAFTLNESLSGIYIHPVEAVTKAEFQELVVAFEQELKIKFESINEFLTSGYYEGTAINIVAMFNNTCTPIYKEVITTENVVVGYECKEGENNGQTIT